MKRPWSDFSEVRSRSFVPGLVSEAQDVAHTDLVEVLHYRKDERITACEGRDPLRTLVAYAQNELAYDENGNIVAVAPGAYAALSREKRLNKFGLAYRRSAPLYQHRILADITVGAAVRLYQQHGWTTVIYDGLRTVEGAFRLYNFATDEDIAAGLLALPGESAHNKGLAVDCMMHGGDGGEIDMGGHFDHLDMETNSRVYDGGKVSAEAKHNRLIREAAFLYSAFSQGLLVAPLRSEFWDDRLPENREDLWRVLDSCARVIGITLLSQEDIRLRKTDRAAFKARWESWKYSDFLARWKQVFHGHEEKLRETIGTDTPPLEEKAEFYHGNFHPIYDRDLVKSGKNLTEVPAASA